MLTGKNILLKNFGACEVCPEPSGSIIQGFPTSLLKATFVGSTRCQNLNIEEYFQICYRYWLLFPTRFVGATRAGFCGLQSPFLCHRAVNVHWEPDGERISIYHMRDSLFIYRFLEGWWGKAALHTLTQKCFPWGSLQSPQLKGNQRKSRESWGVIGLTYRWDEAVSGRSHEC